MTTYAHDIRPKFRDGDVRCMAGKGVLLADAQWMCDPGADGGYTDHGHARRVYAALSEGFMPPDGPWPQEWLDTYQRWIDDGFAP